MDYQIKKRLKGLTIDDGMDYLIQVALSGLTVMSLEAVAPENEWIINQTNPLKRTESRLRSFKKRTGFLFSQYGTTSSAGPMVNYRKEINLGMMAYRFNGAKLPPKKFRWGINFKTYHRGFDYFTNVDTYKKDLVHFSEYASIKNDAVIGKFWSSDPEYHVLGLVAHEFAHTICQWMSSAPTQYLYPRVRDRLDLYSHHYKGWQEVYRKLRAKYVNPYVKYIGQDYKPMVSLRNLTKQQKDAIKDRDRKAVIKNKEFWQMRAAAKVNHE